MLNVDDNTSQQYGIEYVTDTIRSRHTPNHRSETVVTHFTFFLIYIFWYFKRVFQHHLTHCAVEQCHFELFAAKITNNNRHQYTSLYLHSDKVLPQMPTKVLFFLLPFPILNQHFGKWDFEWKAKMMVNYNRIDEFR